MSHRSHIATLQVFDFDHAVRIFAFEEPRRLHRIVLSVAVATRRAVDPNFVERPSLRLVLRRVRQGTLVLEHLAEIAAILATATRLAAAPRFAAAIDFDHRPSRPVS